MALHYDSAVMDKLILIIYQAIVLMYIIPQIKYS